MRIIAGLAKGRNLNSPAGNTRPTSDRAREALFSTLESDFGSLSDLYFLDLYCGSASIAAEALSRGAAVVHAVEKNDEVAEIARANLGLLENIPGVGSASVFTMSVGKYLDTTSHHAATNIKFDIVFADPPYDLPNSDITKIVLSLQQNGFLKNSSVIAIERDSKSKPFEWPIGILPLKERRYGAATIYYAEPKGEE